MEHDLRPAPAPSEGTRDRARRRASRPGRRLRLLALVAGCLMVGIALGVAALHVLGRRSGAKSAQVGLDATGGPDHEALVLEQGTLDVAGLRRAVLLLRRPDALRRNPGGAWLLSMPVRVRPGGRLEIQGQVLRLRSTPEGFVGLEARGGEVVVTDSTLTSWDPDTNSADTELGDGRAYVLARDGARLDVSSSTLTMLGFDDANRSGVAWATRSTGGRVDNGRFVGNYEGATLSAVGPMEITNSRFERSIGDGLRTGPRSRRAVITGNVFSENGRHGLAVTDGSDDVVVRANRAHDNASAGIAVGGAARVLVEDNDVWANVTGIAVGDDALDARIRDNRVSANRSDGVVLSSERLSATLAANRLDHNGRAGIWILDGQAVVGPDNTITKNEVGIGLVDETPSLGRLRNDIRGNVDNVLEPGGRDGLRIQDNYIVDNVVAFSVRTAGDSEAFSTTNTLEGNRLAERVEEVGG